MICSWTRSAKMPELMTGILFSWLGLRYWSASVGKLTLDLQHAFAATQMVAHKAALTPEYAKTSSHETSGSISVESINLAAASILRVLG
ncbi:hypothetical protein EDB82DRAFT_499369 [Fusarium venenatum]|uniref:uncharacterized protein n=1 Tax=Fusarium venenatum TaxID=56646 RepID=UPI001D414066|nr:hypothetical protein EDB82DRAFT_499369 [Fusarium venenatum]